MIEWYYQIKGRLEEPELNMFGAPQSWEFPPLFSGKVVAPTKAEAKVLIEEDYGRRFPLRVLAKDLEANPFLLSIEEIKPGGHIARLFEDKLCEVCKAKFQLIEKYNDPHNTYNSYTYCSEKCKNDHYITRQATANLQYATNGSANPIVYKITNKKTNKAYIGKTTQIFTLRWYQHFFQSSDSKFHKEIKESPITNWTFEVIETIIIPEAIKSRADVDAFIILRERHYINFYNTIEEGYNSKL